MRLRVLNHSHLFLLAVAIGTCALSHASRNPLPSVCPELLRGLQSADGGVWGISAPKQTDEIPRISDYKFGGRQYQSPVKDQCKYGSCWAAVALTVPEIAALKKGLQVELSLDYLIATKLINTFGMQLREVLRPNGKSTKRNYVEEGGNVFLAFETMRKYGFLPSEAWEPERSFGDSRVQDFRLMNNLRAMQAEFFTEVSSIFQAHQSLPETARNARLPLARIGTELGMGPLNDLGMIGLMKADDISLRSEDSQLLNDLIEKYEQRAWTLIVAYLGEEPPAKFVWSESRLTPLKFSRLPVFSADMWTNNTQNLSTTSRKPTEESFQVLKDLIAEREVIPVSLQDGYGFRDTQLALYSVDSFNLTGLTADQYVQATTEHQQDSHAIQIVDYLETQDGKKWLLLKSTWGSATGEFGYFHIPWESFVALFQRVYLLEQYLDSW